MIARYDQLEERKVYDDSNDSGLRARCFGDGRDLSHGFCTSTGEAVAVSHTPGPWRVAAPPDKVCTDYRDEGGSMLDSNWAHGGHAKTIVTCERRSWMAEGEEFANAQLIAAAPDLLDALEEIEQQARRHKHSTAENNGTHIALENIEHLAKQAIAASKAGA